MLVVCLLGLACVVLVTYYVGSNYYSNMESDLRYRARIASDFFGEHTGQGYESYYQDCIIYTRTFDERSVLELQFINVSGELVASSYGIWPGMAPSTPDILNAISNQTISTYIGDEATTGERIMAVSTPILYGNQVLGVLRFVTATRIMDLQIAMISLFSLIALILILVILFLIGNYYIHSILVPLSEIVEKAKKISGGSYGIQISKRYNDEIGELTDTINEMSLRLNENEKVQTEFISSLSHELRTPLTAINGWSETILGDDNLDPNTRRGVRIIQRESDRLTGMVMDLLDFTRIQDGRMNLNMEMVDLRAEFEDAVFMYGSRLSQEGIELVYLENDQDVPELSCDPKRMRQVFLNILDNAAKHGGEGKRIEAEIGYDNGYVRVKIRDFGPGIPVDELSLVKKKFYKGSSKARGSGIGLAVCDEIVQMHGGMLTLENASGGGTEVHIDLPVTQ
jgi:signal transduction histidine kinase